MDPNMELLNQIYQNAKMGEETIKTLLPKVRDTKLREDLQTQRSGYLDICTKSQEEMVQHNGQPEEIGLMTKLSSNMGIKMNTLMDQSNSHIADMMIQGSTMGIVSATEGLHKHTQAEKQVQDLAKDIIQFEQNNIERMKEYL